MRNTGVNELCICMLIVRRCKAPHDKQLTSTKLKVSFASEIDLAKIHIEDKKSGQAYKHED